jgi:hypothetical protein
MKQWIFAILGAVVFGLSANAGAVAAPLAPAIPAAAENPLVQEAAWVTRCHTVYIRRHRHHHHHGWRRVPVQRCHRVHI